MDNLNFYYNLQTELMTSTFIYDNSNSIATSSIR